MRDSRDLVTLGVNNGQFHSGEYGTLCTKHLRTRVEHAKRIREPLQQLLLHPLARGDVPGQVLHAPALHGRAHMRCSSPTFATAARALCLATGRAPAVTSTLRRRARAPPHVRHAALHHSMDQRRVSGLPTGRHANPAARLPHACERLHSRNARQRRRVPTREQPQEDARGRRPCCHKVHRR